MCHHRATEYERLYEDAKDDEDAPEWERDEVPQWGREEPGTDDETEPREPVAPGTAD